VVIRSRIRIPDHFSTSLTIAEWGILGQLAFFHTVTVPADFHDTRRNDWRRQDNESTTYGSDTADIQIRIRINLEIQIRIPDHFWLSLDALVEVCVVWEQSSF